MLAMPRHEDGEKRKNKKAEIRRAKREWERASVEKKLRKKGVKGGANTQQPGMKALKAKSKSNRSGPEAKDRADGGWRVWPATV